MMKKTEMAYDPQGNPHAVPDFRDDSVGAKFGFWVFLLTEMMMFGMLFLLFAIYFYRHAESFVSSSAHLNVWLGGTNTVILLISTYTMGLASIKMQQNHVKSSVMFLSITTLLAIIFLAIKATEWYTDIQNGLYPGSGVLDGMDKGDILFFGLYFVMTGLHGLHVIIGIALMCWILLLIHTQTIRPTHSIILKNVTLYWDFVHLVWILLFPPLYMIGV